MLWIEEEKGGSGWWGLVVVVVVVVDGGWNRGGVGSMEDVLLGVSEGAKLRGL